jgi:y4mF family transcriptional regulator
MYMKTVITDAAQIGQLIKEERKRQKILQQDLADLSGVSWHFLSNLENGKTTVELHKVILVLHALGIGMELITREQRGTRTVS